MDELLDHLVDWLVAASIPIKLGITAIVLFSLSLVALIFLRFVWREQDKPAAATDSTLHTAAPFVTFNFDDNRSVTINMHTQVLHAGDQEVQLQTGIYHPPEGGSVGFTVYVAYAGGVWLFGKPDFDHPEAVDRVFSDPAFIAQLSSKDAVVCVGLESYRDARPSSAYKPALSEERAHTICRFVIKKLKAQKPRPLILGVGLGKNMKQSTVETDGLQRPLIVLGIDDDQGHLKDSEDRLEMVSTIFTSGALVGFTPYDYSVIKKHEHLCWIQMSQSHANKLPCVDPDEVRSVTTSR